MMEMQMLEGRVDIFGSDRSNWWSRLFISLLKDLWILLALTRALGVAGRLDLLSLMTSSGCFLQTSSFCLLFHLQLMDWRLIHFLFSPIFTRQQTLLPHPGLNPYRLNEGAVGRFRKLFFLITIIFQVTMPHIFVSHFRACILAIFWLISLEEHFVEFRVLTVDTYVLPSLYMGWGFSVQTLGPENFTTHELSDESCHCCDTWSKCVSKGVRCGLYMCSIYIIWDDLERVTFTFISGAILFEDNFNEAASLILFILPVFLFLFVLYR